MLTSISKVAVHPEFPDAISVTLACGHEFNCETGTNLTCGQEWHCFDCGGAAQPDPAEPISGRKIEIPPFLTPSSSQMDEPNKVYRQLADAFRNWVNGPVRKAIGDLAERQIVNIQFPPLQDREAARNAGREVLRQVRRELKSRQDAIDPLLTEAREVAALIGEARNYLPSFASDCRAGLNDLHEYVIGAQAGLKRGMELARPTDDELFTIDTAINVASMIAEVGPDHYDKLWNLRNAYWPFKPDDELYDPESEA